LPPSLLLPSMSSHNDPLPAARATEIPPQNSTLRVEKETTLIGDGGAPLPSKSTMVYSQSETAEGRPTLNQKREIFTYVAEEPLYEDIYPYDDEDYQFYEKLEYPKVDSPPVCTPLGLTPEERKKKMQFLRQRERYTIPVTPEDIEFNTLFVQGLKNAKDKEHYLRTTRPDWDAFIAAKREGDQEKAIQAARHSVPSHLYYPFVDYDKDFPPLPQREQACSVEEYQEYEEYPEVLYQSPSRSPPLTEEEELIKANYIMSIEFVPLKIKVTPEAIEFHALFDEGLENAPDKEHYLRTTRPDWDAFLAAKKENNQEKAVQAARRSVA